MRPPCAVCGGRFAHLYPFPDRPKDDPKSYVCRRCYRETTGEPPRGMAEKPPTLRRAASPPGTPR